MTDRTRKNRLYQEFARIGKALAAPARIELLDLLAQGEKTVEALADACEISVKNASAHLRVLRATQLVETRRDGTYVYYRLAEDAVISFVRQAQMLAQARLAEADRAARAYLGERQHMQPITGRDLRERIRAGDVVVLDVRPADEYEAGHLPGAVSIPLRELKKRLRELPTDREVVAYCRGPYCVYAGQAVEILERAGFKAQRTDVGVPDWRLLGHRVEI
ncbi:MAG TPA: metalloregulator ArsR/SmtB family transcription factor [Longimicrobiales bacterium]